MRVHACFYEMKETSAAEVFMINCNTVVKDAVMQIFGPIDQVGQFSSFTDTFLADL